MFSAASEIQLACTSRHSHPFVHNDTSRGWLALPSVGCASTHTHTHTHTHLDSPCRRHGTTNGLRHGYNSTCSELGSARSRQGHGLGVPLAAQRTTPLRRPIVNTPRCTFSSQVNRCARTQQSACEQHHSTSCASAIEVKASLMTSI